jgi:hypothetical protein
MHEIGHVFGNGHVPGTIMDPAQIIEVLSGAVGDAYGAAATRRMTEIDQKRELLMASTGRDIDFREELVPADFQSDNAYTTAFYFLTGRKAQLPIEGQLKGNVFQSILILKDGSGEYSFQIDNAGTSTSGVKMGGPVFELYDPSSNGLSDQWNYGAEFIGELTGLKGEKYPAVLSRNIEYTIDLSVYFNGARLSPFGVYGF